MNDERERSVGAFYEQYWRTRGRSGHRPRYDVFARWIKPGSSVLDLGCGDGGLGQHLVEQLGVTYLGCDLAGSALELARARGLETLQVDLASELHLLAGRKADYVVLSEVVEHVVDAEGLLLVAASIARRAVLVSIPNIAYWRYRTELLRGRFPRQWAQDPREHLRFWSLTDFRDTASALGLAATAIVASNGKPILRDLLPNLFGLQVCFYLQPRPALRQSAP